jgi:alkylation response protein AidB-like acyl-CoA dehydrogenase
MGGQFDCAQRLVAALIEPNVGAMDRERRLPNAVVDALREQKLFSLWLPVEYGGHEVAIFDSLRVIEALSAADGAVGWCACTAAINNRLSAFLSPSAAARIFVEDRAIVAGALMPTGTATARPGGYAVSGRWGYGSGVAHCKWMLGACSVIEDGQSKRNPDGTPETLITFFPTEHCNVIDTWDVGGLRGTGSHDYEVHDLFVPVEFTIKNQGGESFSAGNLYRFPWYSAQGAAISAVILGLAQAAVDRYREITQQRVPRVTSTVARDDPATQEIVGRATAALCGARAFFYEAVKDIVVTLDRDAAPTLGQRANARLAFAHAADTAKYVTRILHDDAGGAGLYEAHGLHRIFRDVHAAAQHAQLHKNGYRTGGRVALGLDPGTPRM